MPSPEELEHIEKTHDRYLSEHKQRFIVIAWPEDHDEGDLASLACGIQDVLDLAQVGGAKVIAPLPSEAHDQLEELLADFLVGLF